MNHCDFHYSHLLPKKPGILPLEETMDETVPPVWRQPFVTRSRIRSVAMHVRPSSRRRSRKRANERLKARRAARRMCLLAS